MRQNRSFLPIMGALLAGFTSVAIQYSLDGGFSSVQWGVCFFGAFVVWIGLSILLRILKGLEGFEENGTSEKSEGIIGKKDNNVDNAS